MEKRYGIYEDENRKRETPISPSPVYQTIPGSISRVQVKSLDARVGGRVDENIVELTVDLQRSAGSMLSTGSTRNFKLKFEAIDELMKDLEAKDFFALLGKRVLTHYDTYQEPTYVAISHPDNGQKAALE